MRLIQVFIFKSLDRAVFSERLEHTIMAHIKSFKKLVIVIFTSVNPSDFSLKISNQLFHGVKRQGWRPEQWEIRYVLSKYIQTNIFDKIKDLHFLKYKNIRNQTVRIYQTTSLAPYCRRGFRGIFSGYI